MLRAWIAAVIAAAALTGCVPENTSVSTWVYQLQNYDLNALIKAPQSLAVIDLAKDGGAGYFSKGEVGRLKGSGKRVLAYFSIGTTENFRPEHRRIPPSLVLNRWADWPKEHFVRYWDPRWWELAVRPRVDQALKAGFDGAYLDVPLAYEEIDLALVKGESRESLGRKMVDLIMKIGGYAKGRRPGFWIFPQNSPELRRYPGYAGAIDGIGMEELFYLATDEACEQDFCRENLDNARALRRQGKLVLAVDYAVKKPNVATACRRYRDEGFAGYTAVLDLDRVGLPCPAIR